MKKLIAETVDNNAATIIVDDGVKKLHRAPPTKEDGPLTMPATVLIKPKVLALLSGGTNSVIRDCQAGPP
jgi:hypothetical protein